MRLAYLPKGWIYGKIEDFSKTSDEVVQTGPFGAQLHASDYVETGVPLILIKNVNGGKILEEEMPKISEGKAKELSRYRLKSGDIVFSRVGSVGRAAVVQENQEGWLISGQMLRIRLENPEIDSKFLSYLIQTNWFLKALELNTVGTTRKSINTDILRNLPLIKPPLPVQRRIVEILDQADALRHLRAQADAETQKLLQSVFYEMFGDPVRNEKGWIQVKLGEICIKIQDGTHYSPKDQNGDIPYITAKNIRFSGIDLTNVTYVPKSIHENIYSRCDPKRGDVIYIKDGVTAGLAKVNNLDFEFSMLSSIAMIRPDSQKLNPYYLEYYLNHPNVYKKIMERKSGSAITRLILREIREIPIILPPLSLQNEFAKIVLNAEQIVTIQAMSRKEIDCLISGLMTKAFTGELN